MKISASLEWRGFLETRLDTRQGLGLRLSSIKGELLKLFIETYYGIWERIYKYYFSPSAL